ncbi:MAG: hypothetical protein U0802_09635 [Candidatus Binatia bacterium]
MGGAGSIWFLLRTKDNPYFGLGKATAASTCAQPCAELALRSANRANVSIYSIDPRGAGWRRRRRAV